MLWNAHKNCVFELKMGVLLEHNKGCPLVRNPNGFENMSCVDLIKVKDTLYILFKRSKYPNYTANSFEK